MPNSETENSLGLCPLCEEQLDYAERGLQFLLDKWYHTECLRSDGLNVPGPRYL